MNATAETQAKYVTASVIGDSFVVAAIIAIVSLLVAPCAINARRYDVAEDEVAGQHGRDLGGWL